MKPEQQRIAIAEACGWLKVHGHSVAGIPDYLNDLNAMHDAEDWIPHHLSHIDYWQKGYGRFQTLLAELSLTPYSATASQRAEAFLRTIGKWEESK
jgi:hypothetical protein